MMWVKGHAECACKARLDYIIIWPFRKGMPSAWGLM